MSYKPIIIVAGEPNSIFLEIFFKSLNQKNFKSPIIIIASKELLIKQMNLLGFNFKINLLNENYLNLKKLNNKIINIINVDYDFKKPFEKISKKSNDYISESFRLALKLMKKNKFGRIINFTTVASPLSLEGEAIYSSIKAGVEKLTSVLSKELGEFGITVNSIGPTPIKTSLMRTVPADKVKALLDMQVFKRYGDFKDISNVIDFYISQESNFITGQKLFLGGIS